MSSITLYRSDHPTIQRSVVLVRHLTTSPSVYSYSQSASCLSGGSLPDPWGERQWAAGDSTDKGDA